MSDSYDKPLPDTLITSPNPASSSEFNDLALEICMATVALKGIRAGESYIAKRPAKNLTAMQHVVSLLSTGTPEELSRLEQDISASQVIAVTGATNVSGRLEGLVLADRNTRGRPLEESDTLKITVEPLKSRLTGEKILAQWRTRPTEQHFEDVFTVIKDFQSGACPSTGNNQALFCALYLSHGYPKIAGRMLHLYKRQLWGKHPIDVLESRLKSGEPFTLTQARPWTVYVNSAATLAKLQKYGISRPSQADTVAYSVTAEEVPKWIRAFTSTYREIEGKLLNADRKSYKYPADVRDIGSAVIPLECLRGFLDSNFLRDLLQDEALSLALAPLSSALSSGSETSDVSGDGDPDLNEEDKVDPDDRQDPEESIGHHVIRYLKTITAPVTAIHALARKGESRKPLAAHVVNLPQPVLSAKAFKSKRTSFINSVLVRVSGTEREKNHAKGFLDKRLRLDDIHDVLAKPTIHVEAGMMALACAFCSPAAAAHTRTQLVIEDDDDVLTSIFTVSAFLSRLHLSHCHLLPQVSEVPIGVGKKCCYCCWELCTWLQDRNDVNPEASVPNFLLLGSHATIFPWYPPQFGIPIEFLRHLLAKLKSALAEEAAKTTSDTGSTQTSARSSGELEVSDARGRGWLEAEEGLGL